MRTVKSKYVVDYYENGNIFTEQYFLNGKCHKTNGPSYKRWDKNGNIDRESYYINGNMCRESDYINGDMCKESYFLNKEQLTKEEFKEIISVMLRLVV